MALMSFQNRSRVNESMVLTRANYLFIHNHIRSLLNIILRPILMDGRGLNPLPNTCVSDALAS